MRPEIEIWIEDANYDLETAKDLFEKKRYSYAVFLSRQSVEKILKANYLFVLKKPFPKEHNLLIIAENSMKEIPKEIKDCIVFLNPHYTITRYPDVSLGIPSKLYDEDFGKISIEKAEKVIKYIKKSMEGKNEK